MLGLRYKQGFTFEEMAAVYGENPKTLQARLTRVLRQLHDEIVAAGS
jgi:DNA-directed RNA polymerase specialized sigma24 family protein